MSQKIPGSVIGAVIVGFADILEASVKVLEKLLSQSDSLKNILETLDKDFGIPLEWIRVALLTLGVFLFIYLLRQGLRKKSRLRAPERFILENDRPEHLKGRDTEKKALGELCEKYPLVFLDGESGCGKSALAKVGLAAWCSSRDASYAPLLIRMDLSGAAWDEGLTKDLSKYAWRALKNANLDNLFPDWPEDDDVFPSLAQVEKRTHRKPLLIFGNYSAPT